MEVQESSGAVPAHHWNKIKPEISCPKEGYRNSFALPMSPLPQDGTAQCQEKHWPVISPQGRVRLCERMLSFSSCRGHHQRDPAVSHPTQSTGVCCMTGEREAAGKTAARALGEHQRDMDPTNCAADSIGKPTPESLGNPQRNPTNYSEGIPSVLEPQAHTHPTLWSAP